MTCLSAFASHHITEPSTLKRLLDYGRNPGLGVRSLHQRGITGRGVSIETGHTIQVKRGDQTLPLGPIIDPGGAHRGAEEALNQPAQALAERR
jgi:hypothetical protein